MTQHLNILILYLQMMTPHNNNSVLASRGYNIEFPNYDLASQSNELA